LARAPSLPADYVAWSDDGGFAAARHDVVTAVKEALKSAPTLYAWAAAQRSRDEFQGRGTTFGVTLGGVRVVVRHARRGGFVRHFTADHFLGRRPRFVREIALARRLAGKGITTPPVLAGIAYPTLLGHTADVATERLDGTDLAALIFGPAPPTGEARAAALTAVGRLVRRLHQAGFVHRDLQLKNVLVMGTSVSAAGRPSSVEAALLDIDTCVEKSPRDHAAHIANIRRFLRSWEKWNRMQGDKLTADDRRVFLAAYDPALQL
jgi:3-deoxy-D-manno-octulosonic acid kinase